jgi:diguanylate cyclase (GGDEF)-like protein
MSPQPTDTRLSRTFASTLTIRLSEVHTSEHFYTPIEERFERITRIARSALRVPVAAISVLKPDKQWFKSISGWSINELSTDMTLCAYTIERSALTVVPDTTADPRFADHPLVAGKPHFRYYAGYPLTSVDGQIIGTFCVMDVKPRNVTPAEKQLVCDIAAIAQLELATDRLSEAQREIVSRLSVSRREAIIDPLTRLWNRRGTLMFLRNTMKQADASHQEMAIGIVDIDNFKRINDLHGHPIGDEALRKAAQVMTSMLRHDDIAGRFGGDEFLVLLPNTNEREAASILNRLREAIRATVVRTREGPVMMTVSVGYTMRQAGDKQSEEDLIRNADDALADSKTAGRNQVQFGQQAS